MNLNQNQNYGKSDGQLIKTDRQSNAQNR